MTIVTRVLLTLIWQRSSRKRPKSLKMMMKKRNQRDSIPSNLLGSNAKKRRKKSRSENLQRKMGSRSKIRVARRLRRSMIDLTSSKTWLLRKNNSSKPRDRESLTAWCRLHCTFYRENTRIKSRQELASIKACCKLISSITTRPRGLHKVLTSSLATIIWRKRDLIPERQVARASATKAERVLWLRNASVSLPCRPNGPFHSRARLKKMTRRLYMLCSSRTTRQACVTSSI